MDIDSCDLFSVTISQCKLME